MVHTSISATQILNSFECELSISWKTNLYFNATLGKLDLDIDFLTQRFKRFAVNECKSSSRLYEFLSMEIAGDNDLLELSSQCSLSKHHK